MSEDVVESDEKTCPSCEREFSGTSGFGRYCSRTCYLNRTCTGKWSEKYERCVECKTKDRPHYAKGRCVVCSNRLRTRARKGVAGASCEICGESRVVEAAHILPRKVIGERWDRWMLLNLCPTHHRLYDTGRLNKEEWQKIEVQVKVAFARYRESGLFAPAALLGGVD